MLTDRAASDVTDGTGNYKTGLSLAGSYTVKFEHPDYGSKEVVVNLSAGGVTIQDFVFQANFVSGIVQDEQRSKPIDNVRITSKIRLPKVYLVQERMLPVNLKFLHPPQQLSNISSSLGL
ncbi:MAG: carboxypeptidase-like regulatory domain-containing protein [Saprospiraceae bacterium]